MSDDEPKDESVTDSEEQSEEQPTGSDEATEQDTSADSEQSTEQPTGGADQLDQQPEEQPAESEQPTEQAEEQPAESDQSAEPSEEQPAEGEQPTEQAEEPAAADDQTTEPSEEQPAEGDQPAEQVEEQPADSDQRATAATADDKVAFAGGEEPPGGGGGVQARPSPKRPRPSSVPARHDFAVRFTFGTSMLVESSPFLAKGFYRFEIRADDGTTLATRDWSPVSVTVPPLINFSLTQITRSGEKSPSFDFHVDLSWLPFSTTSTGSPADPNDPDNANMIEKDFRIITTLRPKDNDSTFLTIPPPKGTVVTKIDLHSDIGIVDDVVSAPSTNENDFIAALFNRGVDLDKLVEKGPPQQTKDGKFLYEVKYYGGARIKGATVLP